MVLFYEFFEISIFDLIVSIHCTKKMHMYRAVGAVSTGCAGWPVLNERSFSTGRSARY